MTKQLQETNMSDFSYDYQPDAQTPAERAEQLRKALEADPRYERNFAFEQHRHLQVTGDGCGTGRGCADVSVRAAG